RQRFTRAEPLRHAAAGGSVGAVRSAGSAHRSVVHAHERVLRHWFSDLVEPGHGFLPADVSGAAQSAAFRWAAAAGRPGGSTPCFPRLIDPCQRHPRRLRVHRPPAPPPPDPPPPGVEPPLGGPAEAPPALPASSTPASGTPGGYGSTPYPPTPGSFSSYDTGTQPRTDYNTPPPASTGDTGYGAPL